MFVVVIFIGFAVIQANQPERYVFDDNNTVSIEAESNQNQQP